MSHTDGSDTESPEVPFSQRSSSPILLSSSVSSNDSRHQTNSNARRQPLTTAQLAELFRLTDPDFSHPPTNDTNGYSLPPLSPRLLPHPYQVPMMPLPAMSSERDFGAPQPMAPAPPQQLRLYRPHCTNRTPASIAPAGRSNQRGEHWSNRLQRIGTLYHCRGGSRPGSSSRSAANPQHPSSNFVGPYIPRCPPRQVRSNGANTRLVYPAYLIQHHTSSYARRGQHGPSPVMLPRVYRNYSDEIDVVLEEYRSNRRLAAHSSPWMRHPAYAPVISAAAAFAFGTGADLPPPIAAGLPDTLIASIPRRHLSSKKESDECPICLNVCQDEFSKRLPICGHEFHAGCLDRWLLVKNNCPVCRRVAVVCS